MRRYWKWVFSVGDRYSVFLKWPQSHQTFAPRIIYVPLKLKKKKKNGLRKVKDWSDMVGLVALSRSTSWPLIGLIHGRLDILSQNMKMWVSAVKSISKLNGRTRKFVFSDVKLVLSLEILFKSYLVYFQFSERRCIFHRINPLMIHPQLACRLQCNAAFCLRAVPKKQRGFGGAALTSGGRRGNTEVLLLMTRRRWDGFWSTQSGGRAYAVSHPLSC